MGCEHVFSDLITAKEDQKENSVPYNVHLQCEHKKGHLKLDHFQIHFNRNDFYLKRYVKPQAIWSFLALQPFMINLLQEVILW